MEAPYAADENVNDRATLENTFAVITSIPITTYAFSYDEPDTPQNGMIWFKQAYSSKSGFNVLKKNDIHVYPASAR